ncbi:MAG: DHH family phosphoesterase, partial [Lachnospiraceae bacterium]|nr:DHH family phosphoesterase [Lachnospiraceae bacterium]
MAKWLVANKRADFQTIAQQYGISPVLARLIRNRGITDENGIAEYLHSDMRTLRDPFLLTDMKKAADIVSETIRRGGKIRIVGDYDVDGICSAHILRTAFATLGADADAVLPDRVKDGYGMNVRIVEEAQRDGRDTLVTCDNGIAAMEAVTRAKELGMTVVVTDHHEVPFEMGTDGERKLILPPADAVVDPQRDSGEEAEKDQVICGAVVAFKLAQAVFARMGQSFSQTQEELLPMCALATVCDVMPLSGQNRVIVREGLARMQSCENTGLRALLQVTGLAGAQITCFHAGFVLGPCLNASGRLTSAQMALSLFGEKDESRALQAAQELKDLNDSRKSMTQRGVEQAV